MAEPPPKPNTSPVEQPAKPWPPSAPVSGVEEAEGWKGSRYPNPPDAVNPDVATLRDQWRFAIRQYSRWYSHAWGTAILAGVSFFALGWLIKGSNPLPSRASEHADDQPAHAAASTEK
ncbi:hypothetical protein Cni_G17042 [Canna indica]|uniref:Uncharacterized protein n=1 Tax=Canna indica TaxID=4628 RepID=A0AAQ3KG84_9LILI|nr:hypothetical protein Cni_G17042 [Canna indica]